MDEKHKINVITDTIEHKGPTKEQLDVEPCKKVKLNNHMSPQSIRRLLEQKRKELSSDGD